MMELNNPLDDIDLSCNQIGGFILCTKCQSSFTNIDSYFLHKEQECAEVVSEHTELNEINTNIENDTTDSKKAPSLSFCCPLCFKPECIISEQNCFISMKELIQHLKLNCPLKAKRVAKKLTHFFQKESETVESSVKQLTARDDSTSKSISKPTKNQSKTCRICHIAFASRMQLARHYMKEHRICHTLQVRSKRVYACTFCPSQLHNCLVMVQHYLRNHYQRSTNSLVCHKCAKIFKRPCTLELHQKVCLRQHATRTLRCVNCDKRFLTEHQLRNHRNQVHTDRMFKCIYTDCACAFLTSSHLLQHLKTHNDAKPFICTFVGCNFASKTKYTLHVHMASHEESKRKFSCDYCDYRGSTASMLTRHLRIHVASKPYSCPHCPSKFDSMGALSKHVLHSTKHINLSLYNCSYCSDFQCNSAKLMCEHIRQYHSDVVDLRAVTLNERTVSRLLGIYNISENKLKPAEGETIYQPKMRMPRGATRTVRSLGFHLQDETEQEDVKEGFPFQAPLAKRKCRKQKSNSTSQKSKKTIEKISPPAPQKFKFEVVDLSGLSRDILSEGSIDLDMEDPPLQNSSSSLLFSQKNKNLNSTSKHDGSHSMSNFNPTAGDPVTSIADCPDYLQTERQQCVNTPLIDRSQGSQHRETSNISTNSDKATIPLIKYPIVSPIYNLSKQQRSNKTIFVKLGNGNATVKPQRVFQITKNGIQPLNVTSRQPIKIIGINTPLQSASQSNVSSRSFISVKNNDTTKTQSANRNSACSIDFIRRKYCRTGGASLASKLTCIGGALWSKKSFKRHLKCETQKIK